MTLDPIKLIQITDPHLHAHRDAKMRGVNTSDTLGAVIKHISEGKHQPDGILATGDLVQDETRGGYLRFAKMLRPLDTPVYCIPGNHDAPNLMQELLSDAPFQYCGTASFENWELLLLDSHANNDDGGQFSDTQLQTLDSNLEACADKHAMVLLHHHPVDMGSHWLDGVGLRQSREFLEIMRQHPHVKSIVWGHVHQASDHVRDNIRMLSTPSTCSQFLPNSDGFALDVRPPGYRWIYLYPDGSIETEVVWLNTDEYL